MIDPLNKKPATNSNFLKGTGKMVSLINSKDWSKTSLGPIESWPLSLKITLNILLNSKFPMLLFWGPENLCFYNDAQITNLNKHARDPKKIGKNGYNLWPDVWEDQILPYINHILNGGKAIWNDNLKFPVNKDDNLVAHNNTISYSPVFDEMSAVKGVLAAGMKTPEIKTLYERKKNLHNAVDATKLATWDSDRRKNDLLGNKRLLKWFGIKNNADLTLKLADSLIIEKDRKKVQKAIKAALDYNTGGNYEIIYTILNPKNGKKRIVKALGKTYFDENKIAYRFTGTLQDITVQHKIARKNEKLLAIIESSKEFIGLADLDGNIEYANVATLNMLGWDSIANKNIFDFVYHEDLEKAKKLVPKFIARGYFSAEIRFVNDKTGIPFWLQWNGITIKDSNNKNIGLATVSPNITERKISEDKLKDAFLKIEESEKRFRKIADNAPVFILMTDAEGKITYANKLWLDYTQTTIEEQRLNKKIFSAHPDDCDDCYKLYNETVKNREQFKMEYRVKRDDNVYRWVSNIGNPRYNPKGEFEGYIHAFNDIHDIKIQEQKKDLFIGMASHELKTPVTSIKGFVQLLQLKYENSGDKFLSQALSTMDNQINVLTKLISNLLDVSKIKSGGFEMEKERFLLNDLIKDKISQIRLINVNHEIDYTETEDIFVFADIERIGQVLVNFLTNAIKYAPNADKVEIRTEVNDFFVTVFVKDFGIGIKKENHKKIFSRFFREEGKKEKTFPGFGIGLFIAADIIKKHSGTIGVKSKKGKGSEFYFSVPYKTN